MTLARPCVCLVSSRRQLSPDARTTADEVADLERWLEEAAAAGVDLIQIREPDLPGAVLCRLASVLVARTASCTVEIVVNDRADVAVAAGAHGVHLRSDGPPVPRVRTLAPYDGWMIGRSIHSESEVREHERADYLLFGTVFESTSKPLGSTVAGVELLRQATAATRTPVIAIGGITPERARECVRAGAAGVAAIAVFLPEGRAPGAIGVTRAVRELRAAMAAE